MLSYVTKVRVASKRAPTTTTKRVRFAESTTEDDARSAAIVALAEKKKKAEQAKIRRNFRRNYSHRTKRYESGCPERSSSALPRFSLRGGMQLFFKTLCDRTVVLDCCTDDTVLQLKQSVSQRVSVPATDLRLLCNGRQLLDDRTLASYQLVGGETVFLQIRLRGGAPKAKASEAKAKQPASPVVRTVVQQLQAAGQQESVAGSQSTVAGLSQDGPRVVYRTCRSSGIQSSLESLPDDEIKAAAIMEVYKVLASDVPEHPRVIMIQKTPTAVTTHALYFYGKCSGAACGRHDCAFQAKAHVALKDHKKFTAGAVIVQVTGTLCSDPLSLVRVATDHAIPDDEFSKLSRLGLFNSTGHACHISSAIQTLLTHEPIVNLLRSSCTYCESASCLFCTLGRVESITRTFITDKRWSCIPLIHPFLSLAGVDPTFSADGGETLQRLLTYADRDEAFSAHCFNRNKQLLAHLRYSTRTTIYRISPCHCYSTATLKTPECHIVREEFCCGVLELYPAGGPATRTSTADMLRSYSDSDVHHSEITQLPRCDGCGVDHPLSRTVLQLQIPSTSTTFSVGLNRRTYDATTKQHVLSSQPVELTPLLTIDNTDWHLQTVVTYSGSGAFGHWVTWRRGEDVDGGSCAWTMYDDSTVRRCDALPAVVPLFARYVLYRRGKTHTLQLDLTTSPPLHDPTTTAAASSGHRSDRSAPEAPASFAAPLPAALAAAPSLDLPEEVAAAQECGDVDLAALYEHPTTTTAGDCITIPPLPATASACDPAPAAVPTGILDVDEELAAALDDDALLALFNDDAIEQAVSPTVSFHPYASDYIDHLVEEEERLRCYEEAIAGGTEPPEDTCGSNNDSENIEDKDNDDIGIFDDQVAHRSPLQPRLTGSLPLPTAPQSGDSIMILTDRWLQLILSGRKTLELRHQTRAAGVKFLGCKSLIHGVIETAAAQPINTLERFRELEDQHCVANATKLPYNKTFGLPILRCVAFAEPIPYQHTQGAQGWVRYDASMTPQVRRDVLTPVAHAVSAAAAPEEHWAAPRPPPQPRHPASLSGASAPLQPHAPSIGAAAPTLPSSNLPGNVASTATAPVWSTGAAASIMQHRLHHGVSAPSTPAPMAVQSNRTAAPPAHSLPTSSHPAAFLEMMHVGAALGLLDEESDAAPPTPAAASSRPAPQQTTTTRVFLSGGLNTFVASVRPRALSSVAMPPTNCDYDDVDTLVHNRRTASGKSVCDEHGFMGRDTDGLRVLHMDVKTLIDAYVQSKANADGGRLHPKLRIPMSVFQVWSELPLVAPWLDSMDFEDMLSRYRSILHSHCRDYIDSTTALRVDYGLADTMPYPLAVLFVAASTVTTLPASFYAESFLSALSSLHHVELGVQTPNFVSRSRTWTLLVAEPSEGKSPGVTPMLNALKAAMEERHGKLHGTHPLYHLLPHQTTHKGAIYSILGPTAGYMFYVHTEAGAGSCLPARWATGGTDWDQKKSIDIAGSFLEAANGGSVVWCTADDTRDGGRKKKARATPKASVTQTFEPEPAVTRRENTNVVFCLVHQRNWFRKFWAVLESTRQMGFASRFTFSFGRRPRRQRRMDGAGFATAVLEPIMQAYFEDYIDLIGPKVSFTGDSEQYKVWQMDPAASTLLAHCNRIHRLLMLHTGGSAAFNTPLSKCDYWLPNMALEFELLRQITEQRCQPHHDGPLRLVPVVTITSFHLAMSYFAKRYMGGHAVLQRDIRRTAWSNDDAEEDREDHASRSSELSLAMRILREVPYHCLSTGDVANHMLEFELALSSSSSRRSQVLDSIETAFRLLESRGIGRTVREPTGGMLFFQKCHFSSMSYDTQELVLSEHVPAAYFGSEWCPAATLYPTTDRHRRATPRRTDSYLPPALEATTSDVPPPAPLRTDLQTKTPVADAPPPRFSQLAALQVVGLPAPQTAHDDDFPTTQIVADDDTTFRASTSHIAAAAASSGVPPAATTMLPQSAGHIQQILLAHARRTHLLQIRWQHQCITAHA